jgi:hypothetical protein
VETEEAGNTFFEDFVNGGGDNIFLNEDVVMPAEPFGSPLLPVLAPQITVASPADQLLLDAEVRVAESFRQLDLRTRNNYDAIQLLKSCEATMRAAAFASSVGMTRSARIRFFNFLKEWWDRV